MFKTQDFGRTLMIAALATSPLAALAPTAHAEDVTVRVGDLSRPSEIKAFNQRLDRTADTLCAGLSRADLVRYGACRDAIRQEALAQLSLDQRAQLETPNRMAQVDGDQVARGQVARGQGDAAQASLAMASATY